MLFDDIHRELQILKNADELNEVETCMVRRLMTDLARPGYQVTVPDAEFDRMRDAFVKDVDEANTRVARNHREGYPDNYLDWRKFTREISSFQNRKLWNNDQIEIYDMDFLRNQEKTTAQQSVNVPLLSSPWHQLMLSYEYITLSRMTRGGFFLPQLPKLLKDYDRPDLNSSELEEIIKFGITMLRSEHYPRGAEELFQKVYDTLEKKGPLTGPDLNVYMNSELFLAAMAIHFDRKPEAVRLLKQVLETAGGNPVHVIEEQDRWYSVRVEPLQVVAVRLLSDLRQLTTAQEQSGSLGKVLVREPGYFPGEIPFYFHIRLGFDPKSGKKYRVLLLIGQANHGGLEYADGDNTWTRFADAHDLFLVVPHLLNYWTYPFHPQEFIGNATLHALEKIRARLPDPHRSTAHGRLRVGGEFHESLRHAAPGDFRAISLNSIDNLEWQEAPAIGEHPLSDLKQIPCLVTCEEESVDPYISGNFSNMVRFVSFARAAGVPVIWKSIPRAYSGPTPEMEQLTQAFLADALDESGKKERFTGDLRTWKYFPAGDKRIGDIPPHFRQELPDRPVAQLWGEEQK